MFNREAYLIFELGDLPLAGGITLQVVQHNLCISQKDFGPLQVFLQPLLCFHISLAHLNDKTHLSSKVTQTLFFYPPSKPTAPLETQKRFLSNQKKWHTLNCTDRDQRQSDRSTWSWAFSSLDSSSLLSRNTFCLSSYSSSSCTSICFSCRTHEQECQDAQTDDQ